MVKKKTEQLLSSEIRSMYRDAWHAYKDNYWAPYQFVETRFSFDISIIDDKRATLKVLANDILKSERVLRDNRHCLISGECDESPLLLIDGHSILDSEDEDFAIYLLEFFLFAKCVQQQLKNSADATSEILKKTIQILKNDESHQKHKDSIVLTAGKMQCDDGCNGSIEERFLDGLNNCVNNTTYTLSAKDHIILVQNLQDGRLNMDSAELYTGDYGLYQCDHDQMQFVSEIFARRLAKISSEFAYEKFTGNFLQECVESCKQFQADVASVSEACV